MSTVAIGFDEIIGRVAVDALLEPIASAFLGPVVAPPRHHHTVAVPGKPEATLLLMPAWTAGDALGVKVVTVHPGNAGTAIPTVNGAYLLLRAESGEFVACLDGRALTLLRTAAVSALACRVLARAGARRLLIAGTGALAPHLARGHAAVRHLEHVAIWGRDPLKARCVAELLAREGFPAVAAPVLEAACTDCDIVSCATMSTAPLIRSTWLRAGTHVDLVGAFRPDMRETDSQLIGRGLLVVDSERAVDEAGDLAIPLREGVIDRARIRTLAAILGAPRPAIPDLSVFKSVGTAIADLAAARVVAARCRPSG